MLDLYKASHNRIARLGQNEISLAKKGEKGEVKTRSADLVGREFVQPGLTYIRAVSHGRFSWGVDIK